MPDDEPKRLGQTTRRAVLAGLASVGGVGLAQLAGGATDGDQGDLTVGAAQLQQAYNSAGDIWVGPDSAKSSVAAQSGRLYFASDTGVVYYGDGGNWDDMGSLSPALVDSGNDTADGGDLYQFASQQDSIDLQGTGEIQNAAAISAEEGAITKQDKIHNQDRFWTTTPGGDVRNVYFFSDYASDDAAVNAAIADIPTADPQQGGTKLVFPYRPEANNPITVENGIEIDKSGPIFEGCGALNGTVFKAADSLSDGTAVIKFADDGNGGAQYNGQLRDLEVHGNKSSRSSGHGIYVPAGENWKEITIRNVQTIDAPEDGARLETFFASRIRTLVTEFNGRDGLYADGDSGDVEDLWSGSNKRHGANLQGQRWTISGRCRMNDQHGWLLGNNGFQNRLDDCFAYANSQQSSGSYNNYHLGGNGIQTIVGCTAVGDSQAQNGFTVFGTDVRVKDCDAFGHTTEPFTSSSDVVFRGCDPTPSSGAITDGTVFNGHASGTYTGDGTTGRTISVGARPQVVYVKGSDGTLYEVRDDGLSPFDGSDPAGELSITNSGFTVGDNSADADPNTDTESYTWSVDV